MRVSSTFVVVIATCIASAANLADPFVEGTVRYLHSLAIPAGGFKHVQSNTGDANQATLRATSGVHRTLGKLARHSSNPRADAAFVERCFDSAVGGFAARPGDVPDVFHTAVGLMTVAELKLPMEKFRVPALKYLNERATSDEDIRITAAALEALNEKSPNAVKWIRQITAQRNADGTLGHGGEIPVKTAGMAMTVLRLGGDLPNRANVVCVLRDGQSQDGGYGVAKNNKSNLESCYRVVRALVMLREKPRDVNALKHFVTGCRNDDGGYGLWKGDGSSASGCYFAAFVLDWLK